MPQHGRFVLVPAVLPASRGSTQPPKCCIRQSKTLAIIVVHVVVKVVVHIVVEVRSVFFERHVSSDHALAGHAASATLAVVVVAVATIVAVSIAVVTVGGVAVATAAGWCSRSSRWGGVRQRR